MGYFGSSGPNVQIEETPDPIIVNGYEPLYRPENDPAGMGALELAADNAAQIDSVKQNNDAATSAVSDTVKTGQKAQALKTFAQFGRADARGAASGKNFSGGRIDAGKVIGLVADLYTFGGYSAAKGAAGDPGAKTLGDMPKSVATGLGAKGVAQTGSGTTTTPGAAQTGVGAATTPPTGASVAKKPEAAATKTTELEKGGSNKFLGYAGTALGILSAVRRDPNEQVQSPLVLR